MERINYSGQADDDFTGYDEGSVCPQCGGDNVDSSYRQSRRIFCDPDQLGKGNSMIKRTCIRCLFYWFEWPI